MNARQCTIGAGSEAGGRQRHQGTPRASDPKRLAEHLSSAIEISGQTSVVCDVKQEVRVDFRFAFDRIEVFLQDSSECRGPQAARGFVDALGRVVGDDQWLREVLEAVVRGESDEQLPVLEAGECGIEVADPFQRLTAEHQSRQRDEVTSQQLQVDVAGWSFGTASADRPAPTVKLSPERAVNDAHIGCGLCGHRALPFELSGEPLVVVVLKSDPTSGRGLESEIACASRTEGHVGTQDTHARVTELVQGLFGRDGRSVVDDDQLEFVHALVEDGSRRANHALWSIVGREHDADQWHAQSITPGIGPKRARRPFSPCKANRPEPNLRLVTDSSEAPEPARAVLAPRPRGFVRRGVFELLGLKRYSRPALNGIDRKLERYLSFDRGFFVEAGANDGYTQSNTYYLERFRKWRGVLVEPLPALYERCRRERPRSQVFRCALVAEDYESGTASMLASNLTSLVRGALKSPEADAAHCRAGARIQETIVTETHVPARTLTSVLDEAGAGRVDFLSLDVEGYELQALNGLDIERFRPRYVLVEARFREEIDRRLNPHYDAIDELTDKDVLYRWKEQ